VLGFTCGEPRRGFHAIGRRDRFERHLKCTPKNEAKRRHRRANDHLDLSAAVTGIDAFHSGSVAKGAAIIKPLAPTAWRTKEFHVLDPAALCSAARTGAASY
jgi:hypothetical protein